MGRKPRKGHVHIYAKGIIPKTKIKKKAHILKHCKSPIHQYGIKITKRECWLYSPRALVPWAAGTSLKPGQAWFPRMDCHGADRAGEGVPANEPCSMDLVSLLPSARAHHLQMQWNWEGRALKSPVGFLSPGGGIPTTLGSPHLRMKALSTEWCFRNWDLSKG